MDGQGGECCGVATALGAALYYVKETGKRSMKNFDFVSGSGLHPRKLIVSSAVDFETSATRPARVRQSLRIAMLSERPLPNGISFQDISVLTCKR